MRAMTAKFRRLPTGNVVYGRLPKGCQLCLRGRKSVIFVTGLCPRRCFYCPLSRERKSKDVVFVNELKVGDVRDVVREVAVSLSTGASLTGGDPLVRPKRTLNILKLLKSEFGENFHVHLYTSGISATRDVLSDLVKAGLDEIRFHPPENLVTKLLDTIAPFAEKLDVGFELPVLPNGEKELCKVIEKLEKTNIKFVNLNELEFSETNYAALLQRGYQLAEDYIATKGSKETALKILHYARQHKLGLSVHYCPANSKDLFQTSLRLYRRGLVTAHYIDYLTDNGTIVRIEDAERKPQAPPLPLGKDNNTVIARVEWRDWLAKGHLVERHPTWDRFLVYSENL